MVKTISTLSLKPGYDPNETYQIWLKDHVPYVKRNSTGMKRYVIGRVVHNLTGGEFYGAVQITYETLEDAIRSGNNVWEHGPDEFMKRTTNVRRVIIQEEDVTDYPVK